MLWLALLTRDTGIPASKRLGIKDEVIALDFDLAVTNRLFLYQTEERKALAKHIAYEVAKWWSGDSDDDDDSILDHDVIRNDPYADENTQYW
jgi:hypothetical protein